MRGFFVAALLSLGLYLPAFAQDASLTRQYPILTVDQDRLFSETRIGAEALAAFETAAAALAAENERIERELIEEERRLTDERDQMSAEDFTLKADAFDARVRQIRAEQDQKARDLNVQRDLARRGFFDQIADEISAIVREKGALVVLDLREVFLSADSIDITDEAIARVNDMADRQ